MTAIAFMQVLDFKLVHAVGSHKNRWSVVEQAPVTQRLRAPPPWPARNRVGHNVAVQRQTTPPACRRRPMLTRSDKGSITSNSGSPASTQAPAGRRKLITPGCGANSSSVPSKGMPSQASCCAAGQSPVIRPCSARNARMPSAWKHRPADAAGVGLPAQFQGGRQAGQGNLRLGELALTSVARATSRPHRTNCRRSLRPAARPSHSSARPASATAANAEAARTCAMRLRHRNAGQARCPHYRHGSTAPAACPATGL